MKKLLLICLLYTHLVNAQVWKPYANRFVSPGVFDLINYNNDLFISGNYFGDSTNIDNISRWDNSDWQSLGTGIQGGVYSMANFNGELYLGGNFIYLNWVQNARKIFRWDGISFHPLEKGITSSGQIDVMLTYNNNLYVGGNFQQVDSLPIHTIAKWDGATWSSVCNITGSFAEVESMAIFNGELYIGGYFSSIDGVPMQNIAKYNGTSWSTVGDGLNSDVIALAVDSVNNCLYASGNFGSTGNGSIIFPSNVAYWDGAVWTPVGNGPALYPTSLAIYKSRLYVGGYFSHLNNVVNASGDTLNFICNWNGNDWQPLGKGLNGSVQALTVFNNNLIVGGGFTMAGDSVVNYVTAYTDTTTGLSELALAQQQMEIVPNPACKQINIKSISGKINVYSIINQNGQIIKNKKLKPTNDFTIDIGTLPKGVYILTVSTNNSEVSRQFIKK